MSWLLGCWAVYGCCEAGAVLAIVLTTTGARGPPAGAPGPLLPRGPVRFTRLARPSQSVPAPNVGDWRVAGDLNACARRARPPNGPRGGVLTSRLPASLRMRSADTSVLRRKKCERPRDSRSLSLLVADQDAFKSPRNNYHYSEITLSPSSLASCLILRFCETIGG